MIYLIDTEAAIFLGIYRRGDDTEEQMINKRADMLIINLYR